MPIKVPVYERRVHTATPSLSAPRMSKPNQAAFVSQSNDAVARMGQSITGNMDAIARAMAQKKGQEEDRQVFELDTQFRTEMQDALYKQDTDDNGRPVGILVRQKTHASGVTPEFDQKYHETKKKYLSSLGDPRQQAALSKLMDNHYESLRGNVIRHEAEQGRTAFTSTLDASLKTRIAGAAIHKDPGSLVRDLDDTIAIQSQGLSRMGATPEELAQKNQELASSMVKSAFDAHLETSWQRAGAFVEAAKDRMHPAAYASFKQAIEGKRFGEEQIATWNEVKGFQLSDGTMDTAKMEQAIFAKNLPAEKKEKLVDYVRAKAGEANQQRKQQDSATDHTFKNHLLQGKQNGMVLDDALKLAAQFPGDSVSIHERQEIAKKLYTTDVKTDPYAYNGLWTGIQEGRFGAPEINRAFKENRLSGSDFMELTKLSYNSKHKFEDQDRRFVLDYIQDKAKSLPQKKRDGFMYMVLRNSHGKTPQEIFKIAEDLGKDDPNSGYFFQDPVYESKLKQTQATDLVWGKYDEDLGRGVAMEIGRGATFKGKKAWGPGDVDEFAGAFGGYEKIKAGTPVNRAIELIREQNAITGKSYPVTVENVRAIMKKFGLKEE